MFRIAISLICVAVVVAVAVAVGMALATLFHTPAWHGGAVGMVGSFSCLVLLLLLIQRAVWKSSPRVLQTLFWPTAVIAAIIGVGGATIMFNDLRLGGYVAAMGVLAAFALWRTRTPRPVAN